MDSSMQPLFAIFALGKNDAIGRAGGLPWNYPVDAKYFDEVTRGHAVIMGRRTWQERAEPLRERRNLVVSRTMEPRADVSVFPDLDQAIAAAYTSDPTPFVIGGAALFEAAMPLVTRVYLTRIPESPAADTFFRFDATPFEAKSSRETDEGLFFSVLERRA
jgi:dihydrofolate reductase